MIIIGAVACGMLVIIFTGAGNMTVTRRPAGSPDPAQQVEALKSEVSSLKDKISRLEEPKK